MANQILAGAVFQAGQVIAGIDADTIPDTFIAAPSAETYVVQDDISTNPPSLNTSYGFYPVDEAAGHTINDYSFLHYGNQTGSIFLQKGDWTVVGDSSNWDADAYLDIYYQNEKNTKTYAWNHTTDILGGGQNTVQNIRPQATILTETHIFVTTVLISSPNTSTVFKVNLSSGVVEGTYVFSDNSHVSGRGKAGLYISDDILYLPSNTQIARYDMSSNTRLSTWSESHIAGSGYMNGKFNNGFDVKGDTIVAVADWNSSASFPNTGDGKEHVIAIDKNTGVRKWGIRYTGISGTIHWTGYPYEGLHLLGDDKVAILTYIDPGVSPAAYTPLVYDRPTDTLSNLIGTFNDGQNNSAKQVDIKTIGDYLLILAQYNNSHMKKLHWYHKDDLTTPVMTTGLGLVTNIQDLSGGGYAQHGIYVQDDLKVHYLNKRDSNPAMYNSGTKVDVWEFTLTGTTITNSGPTFIAPSSVTTSQEVIVRGQSHYNSDMGRVIVYSAVDNSIISTIDGTESGRKLGTQVLLTDDYILASTTKGVWDDDTTSSIHAYSTSDLTADPIIIGHPLGKGHREFGQAEGQLVVGNGKLFINEGNRLYICDLSNLSAAPVPFEFNSSDGGFDSTGNLNLAQAILVFNPYDNYLYVGQKNAYGGDGAVTRFDTNTMLTTGGSPETIYSVDAASISSMTFGRNIAIFEDCLYVSAKHAEGSPLQAVYKYNTSSFVSGHTAVPYLAKWSGSTQSLGSNDDFGSYIGSISASSKGTIIGAPNYGASDWNGGYVNTGRVYYMQNYSNGTSSGLTQLNTSSMNLQHNEWAGQEVYTDENYVYATFYGRSFSGASAVAVWSWDDISAAPTILQTESGSLDIGSLVSREALPTFIVPNDPPVISGIDASYTITTGSDTVITGNATDPEGDVVTWTYVVSSGSLNDTTVSQADNVFTVIPGSVDATFQLSFTATDDKGKVSTHVSDFTYYYVEPVVQAQLWRLYANDVPSYVWGDGHLWDISDAGGITLGDGRQLSTSGTSGNAMSATFGQIPVAGKYGIYTSNNSNPFTQTTANASTFSPGQFSGQNMFNGQRTYWASSVGHSILWYLHDPIDHTAMEGGSVNLRTHVGNRPDRCPQEILLQYYTGDLNGTYNSANWSTFATLRSNQTEGSPTWTNITEGSIKTV